VRLTAHGWLSKAYQARDKKGGKKKREEGRGEVIEHCKIDRAEQSRQLAS
jgi:hypothetical protein